MERLGAKHFSMYKLRKGALGVILSLTIVMVTKGNRIKEMIQ